MSQWEPLYFPSIVNNKTRFLYYLTKDYYSVLDHSAMTDVLRSTMLTSRTLKNRPIPILIAEDRQKLYLSLLSIAEKQGMKTWVCMPSPIQVTCACRWQLVQQRTHLENNRVKSLYMNPYQWTFGHDHDAWSLRHVQLNRSSQVWRRRNGCRYTATVVEAQLYQLSRSLVRLHTYVRIIIQVSWNDAMDISTIFIIVAPGVPDNTDSNYWDTWGMVRRLNRVWSVLCYSSPDSVLRHNQQQ